MIRGLFLNGSMKGILYYVRPDLSRLNDSSVWVDAASQTFFSLGPGFGVLMAFASYNDFHHNVFRYEIHFVPSNAYLFYFISDAMITVVVNSVTSFASGIVIFMFFATLDIKDVILTIILSLI